jgi:hypothetical protein
MKLKLRSTVLSMALVIGISCLAMPATGHAAKKGRGAPLYWGAQIGTQITGEQPPWDMNAVYHFQRKTGKGLSLLQLTSPFADCTALPCSFYPFPTPAMENARLYGAIPILSWASTSSPPLASQPKFQLSDVTEGRYDGYIREFATAAKAWGHPFFLRFNWEMNGVWFPWSDGANSNSPGDFVASWRHVHDIFASVGATNATWVWCPNVNIGGELQPLRQVYPGDKYVDWTCLDGFNWGHRGGSPGWLSFDKIFRRTYSQAIKLAPSKPMMIGETASTDKGGSKPAWIKHALRAIRTRYRKVRAVVWFDVNDRGSHWPIERSRKQSRAFQSGIRNSAYRPNEFRNLPFGPILPPPRRAETEQG